MKNKNIWKTSGLLLICLIMACAVIWWVFTAAARKELNNTLNETNSAAKLKLQNYEYYTANDRVKSLVRLLDKSKELRRDISTEEQYGQQELDEYVSEQRLSGAFIIDADQNMLLESANDTELDAEKLWKMISDKNYISDVLEHPEETYTERVTVDGREYDIAVVPQQNKKGLVIAYSERNDNVLGDLTIDSVFSDFSLGWNGVIIVCKEDAVVSTNQPKLLGMSEQELQNSINDIHEEDEGIIKAIANNKAWCGQKDKMGEYVIYIFFPADKVYMTRTVVCIMCAAITLFIFLIVMLIYSNAERETLKQSQKRLRTINALGTAYSSIVLLNLETQRTEIIKKSEDGIIDSEENWLSKGEAEQHVRELLTTNYQEEFLKFIDTDTIDQRMKGQRSLTCTYQLVSGKWILSVLVPQKLDENGKITAILIANRDVTADKEQELEQESELRDALAVAEHASKAKSTFLSSMSHDIRTPMNAIIGFTALAQTHMDDKVQVQDYLSKISTSSTHLLSLINDILDMSRIESGTVKLEEKPVHIPDVLHDLRAMIQGLVNSKSLNLYIDAQDVVNEDAIADKLRLNQILLNIISNAIKFTEPGGDIIVRILEKPCEIKHYTTYEISVKDNGIGMSEEFLAHVFDTFSREQSSTISGIQGTGLGMAITKNIVEMMGGEIRAESEEGRGSVFTVTLNLRLANEPVQMEPIPELLGARALVVDDDLNTCRSVSKMLRDIKMRPDWTASGKEAVVRAQDAADMKDEYKVYIIDYLMPDMNGIETVRRIRKVISEDVPIIVLTAYDWTDFEHEARQAGVTAFVSKPIFMSELRNVLTQPVISDSITKEAENTAEENTEKKIHDYSGKRILLAEDNELNREIATAILEETGMIIDSVDDGDAAVAAIDQAPADRYDLILMDIQMPKMDGYTATREIRTLSDNRKANIPIVAMTANAFEEDKQLAYKAGMNGHIIKPISLETIAKVLDEIFAGKSLT